MPIFVQRLIYDEQTLEDSYSEPNNYLSIEVTNPKINTDTPKKYTDYEVVTKTNIPIFSFRETVVRRRYKDFLWLREQLEQNLGINLPRLPSKGLFKQLPFRNDNGIFTEDFIEDRRIKLERFLQIISTHPTIQCHNSLHMFLHDVVIDKDYMPETL